MEDILSGVKNIYLVGIGGIGMTGLALLLKDKGFCVRGSDIQDSYNLRMLRESGVEVFVGHKKENIKEDVDLVCYSSAIRKDNPEILEAEKKRINTVQRGKLLGLLTNDKKTIAVSGSHGKTTTSSFIGYLLTSLGYRPTVFVGGIPLNYQRNAWWGGEYCVIETDESDGSFLYYNPWVSVITNVDYEHLDYYSSIDNLRESFLKFACQTKELVIGCGDENLVREILSKVNGLSYGFEEQNRVQGKNFSFEGGCTFFDLFIDHKFISRVKISLLGKHNVLNTLAVLSLFFYMEEDLNKVIEILKDFKGTKRRFQVKDTFRGITFVDDYAHHPSEIKAVIGAAHLLNPKRILVVWQPHRFSRVKLLYEQFIECFSSVDKLVVTDIYAASEQNISGINSEELCKEIKERHSFDAEYVPKTKLFESMPLYLEEGDLVLALGAGDINSVMEQVINELKRNRITAQH
jgi:UDP-N-acetylmuramate--alanine ligase